MIDTADMSSFWDEGYNGLMVGSLYALTGWMNTEQDTYEKLDLEQCANVARIMVAYLALETDILGPAATDDDDSDDDDDDTGEDDVSPDDDSRTDSDDDDDDESGCCG